MGWDLPVSNMSHPGMARRLDLVGWRRESSKLGCRGGQRSPRREGHEGREGADLAVCADREIVLETAKVDRAHRACPGDEAGGASVLAAKVGVGLRVRARGSPKTSVSI